MTPVLHFYFYFYFQAFYRAAPMQIFIIPDDEALLTDDFLLQVSALEDVPFTDDNFHLFEDFFDHFGLYYVARFALGGLFRQVGAIDRKLFKEVLKGNETRLEELLRANLAYTLGLGADRPTQLLDPEDPKMAGSSFANIVYGGGNESLVTGDPAAWLNSFSPSNLVPIQVTTDRITTLLRPFKAAVNWQNLSRALEYWETRYKLQRLRSIFEVTQHVVVSKQLDRFDDRPVMMVEHSPLKMIAMVDRFLAMSPTELIADLEGGPIRKCSESDRFIFLPNSAQSRKISQSFSGTVMRSGSAAAENGKLYHTFERDFLPKAFAFIQFYMSYFSDEITFGNDGGTSPILSERANRKFFMEREEEEEFIDSDEDGGERIVRKRKKQKITRRQRKRRGKGKEKGFRENKRRKENRKRDEEENEEEDEVNREDDD